MPHRGKLFILGIFVLAAVASVLSLAYLSGQSDQARAFWGSDAAALILRAPNVEVWRLGSSASGDAQPPEVMNLDGQEMTILEKHDAAEARGLVNVRRGLVSDSSFAWNAPPPAAPPTWNYALRFAEGDREAIVLFSLGDDPRAALAGGTRAVSIEPVAAGLEAFLEEQFQKAEPK